MKKRILADVGQKPILSVVFVSLLGVGGMAVPSGHGQALASETSDHPDETKVVLQQSKPLVSRNGAWQNYSDSLHIRSGQEKSAELTFTNGADGRPPLTDMRVDLARKPFVTLKDFAGKPVLTSSLSGKVSAGNTPITVHCFGPSGARLNWKLVVDRPVISAVNPETFGGTEQVTVQGKNFSSHPHDLHVSIGGKTVNVSSASETELKLKLPAHLPGGSQDLVVAVQTAKSIPFHVKVKSNPEITWVDHLATSPGHPVQLTGKGFSTVPQENIVKFGHAQAVVTAATETKISCVVPQMDFPRWHVPITVTTNGVKSKGHASINIDVRVIENGGVPMP